MIDFIFRNAGTILVSCILLLIVFLIITSGIRNRKNGSGSCGCSCKGCGLSGRCNDKK